MGLFGIFGSNPTKDFEKAETLAAKGDFEKALSLLEKVLKKEPENAKAISLADDARSKLIESFVTKAQKSEQAQAYEDAALWTQMALNHAKDEAQQSELENRIKSYKQQAFEAAEEDAAPVIPEAAKEEAPIDEHDLDPDSHYHMLIGMLRESQSERYENRPDAFRDAYLALNSGDLNEASGLLDGLLETHPDDPIYQFERARCALYLDQPELARNLLETAWPKLGDKPIDAAGQFSPPAMWADALLRLDQPGRVVERLEDLADPRNHQPDLTLFYAGALAVTDREEDAAVLLGRGRRVFERDPRFPLQLAETLDKMERTDDAITHLETAVTPTCASGNCGAPPKHLPSLRFLASLYIKKESGLERARELLNHIAHAMNGQLSKGDYHLLAAYHRLSGNEDAAQQALAEAETAGDGMAMQAVTPKISTGDKAVL